jgi:hypothetical protein
VLTLNYTPPSDRFFILASGPSLIPQDVELVRGKGTVIAVNRTIDLAPWADILYACDLTWWRNYNPPDFAGKRYSIHAGEQYGCETLPFAKRDGLGKDRIHSANNSGYQAINLAYLLGAKAIILLGYDMQATWGRKHFHKDYPKHMSNATALNSWARYFPALARDLEAEGVKVINCTRETALTCFERRPLESVL